MKARFRRTRYQGFSGFRLYRTENRTFSTSASCSMTIFYRQLSCFYYNSRRVVQATPFTLYAFLYRGLKLRQRFFIAAEISGITLPKINFHRVSGKWYNGDENNSRVNAEGMGRKCSEFTLTLSLFPQGRGGYTA